VSTAEQPRSIEGEKAQRIIDAMRTALAQKGLAGATFEHVAREAGVSRGLLHYYFGSKERMLAEVVRRDCELRMHLLDEQLHEAASADDFIALMRGQLEDMIRLEPELLVVIFELFVLARRNDEVAAEFRTLLQRTREHVAELLAVKEQQGVLSLKAPPEAVADVLYGIGDGVAMRMLSEPDRDWSDTIETAVLAVRALLT